jgi:uncharacterized protein
MVDETASIESMNAMLLGLVQVLVDAPEKVKIVALAAPGGGTCFQLRVAPEDLGKVIGKQGRTARSIRAILSAASMKQQRRFTVDIGDGEYFDSAQPSGGFGNGIIPARNSS